MAINEAARQTPEPIVVADTPDVCLTPMGSAKVPVPYPIMAYFNDAQMTTSTVVFTEDPVFTTQSAIPSVVGDEAGVDKGVVSGSHAGGGYCHVVETSHTMVVKTEGCLVVYHSSKMEMNCVSPDGAGNTIGTVIWQSTSGYCSADENGDVQGDTDPAADPETPEEVDAATASADTTAESPESKWSGRNSEGELGYNQAKDSRDSNYRNFGTPHDSPPDGVTAQTQLKVGADNQFFDESYQRWGDDQNFAAIGRADAQGGLGITHSPGGETFAGGQLKGHVAAFQAQGTAATPGNLASVDGNFEVLSGSGALEGGGFTGPDGTGGRLAASLEGDLAKVEAGGALRITPKTIYDSSVGAFMGWLDPESEYAEAGDNWDYGVVVGLGVELGVGAGAAAEGELKAGSDGMTATGRVSLGLGPKVAIKPTAGIALPEGTLERAGTWIKSWF